MKVRRFIDFHEIEIYLRVIDRIGGEYVAEEMPLVENGMISWKERGNTFLHKGLKRVY